jgi:hypothetical protein
VAAIAFHGEIVMTLHLRWPRSVSDRPQAVPGKAVALLLTLAFWGSAAPASSDRHTIALWLFDEPQYPNMTLTDAGPYQNDLRLETAYARWWQRTDGKGEPEALPLHVEGKAGLVPGKFGNALKLPVDPAGEVRLETNRLGRYGSNSYIVGAREWLSERMNFGYTDWTMEFWFKATQPQRERGALFELRNETGNRRARPAENALMVEPGRRAFLLSSRLLPNPDVKHDEELAIPTDPTRLNDGEWHHVAFTFTAAERQVRHYLDGRMQPLSAKGSLLPAMGALSSWTLGRGFVGLIDEMRISGAVRYRGDFPPPGTFSVTQAADRATTANGPPLLFAGATTPQVVHLGSRKHLFIDDSLLESKTSLELRVNPPERRTVTEFRCTEPWEATPRLGPAIPDICSVWDDGTRIRMIYTNNGMWGGKPNAVCLAESGDGLHWDKPVVGQQAWEGSIDNNIVLANSFQGTAIRDPNPSAPAHQRYKLVTWSMYRGLYLFFSPDGIRWTRNETIGLPFDPDGSTSFFWDDQAGVYRVYTRAAFPGRGRQYLHAAVRQLFRPWPFKPAPRPFVGDMWLSAPVSGELPAIDTGGEVYRLQAVKYPWAPDTYLAFPWRYDKGANIRPGSFLMVSRDGENWRRYEDPYYFPSGWTLDGRTVQEALMEQGLVRRGNEIWQYGTVRFTEHGGVLYKGVEHEGGYFDRLLRLSQRLDGFVSLASGGGKGTALTRPLVFAGNRLRLNAISGGAIRVGVLDQAGKPVEGLALEDCEPIRGDKLEHEVRWKGGPALGRLEGKTVRLKFELTDARLFAMQFGAASPAAR